ncbi:DUF4249 domain-containing protein [Hymenobacter antarcticus]|uniref:DUF4249 domain-containing protein n=1 Tax=Hymenobacter antarcticus TaxID=486270 RepID=A0ABP7QGH0_9BACT
MKTHFLPLAVLLAALALVGCETTVNLPEPPHTPRVALRYTLTTNPQDSSFQELYVQRQLYISNSQRVFDTRELLGRPDATVELRDAAGAVVERYRPTLINNSGFTTLPGFYRPVLGFRPQVGQRYTLRASLPGLETAESTLTMPTPAAVVSGSYVDRTAAVPNSNVFKGRLNLVIQDDPNAANYYLAFARVLDQQGQPGPWSSVDVDYDSQSSSVSIGQFQLSSPQQQYSIYPFADTDLNGQRISLSTDVRFYRNCFQGPCPLPGYLEVHVSSITPEAYNFYLSRRRYYDSDGNPFAEPAPLASNVRSGYGLFGGATDVTYRIRIF